MFYYVILRMGPGTVKRAPGAPGQTAAKTPGQAGSRRRRAERRTGAAAHGTEDQPPVLLAGAPQARPSTMLVGAFGATHREGGQRWSGVAMFVNTMPRYEILSAGAVGVLDRGW